MAAPVDAGRATTSFPANASPWTVNLPGSIAAGDLLVIYVHVATPARTPSATDWTLLDDDTTDASGDYHGLFYRVADGSEGASVSFAMAGGSAKGATIAWRVTGAKTTGTILTFNVTTTTAANLDPPSAATDGGASADVLSIAVGGVDGETQTFSAGPSGYSNLTTENSGTAGVANTNCVIAGATRQRTAVTSEDPGAFTNDAPTNGGTVYTVLAHAAAAGGATKHINVIGTLL